MEKPEKKNILLILLAFFITVCVIFLCLAKSQTLKEVAISFYSYRDSPGDLAQKDSVQLTKQIKETQRRISVLQKTIENLSPASPYLIINTTKNTFVLRTKKDIIREGICSTGSYILLDAGDGQQWIFKTPKGQLRILGKITNPVWIKPDWAFIEESLPVPSKNDPERREPGSLGDYALTLGDGYMIHGTLYQRFLGLPVTHGCVRLGDDDLKTVFNNMEIGSKVFIF